MSTTIPIQELDTSTNPPKDSTINAVVTLLWPYSSSTRQCALLLSERDFRLRARGGQIRVKFSGPAARAVAEKRLGIGDEVKLQLGTGEWVRDEAGAAVHIPGRSVGELQFGRGVQLRVQREGAEGVEINVAEDAVDEVREEVMVQVPTTPAKRASPSASNFRSSFGGTPVSAAIYSSPAFMRKAAKFSYLDGISRLFEEEWENQDLPRKKARTSIGEVREWKIVDRTPSPVALPPRPAVEVDEEMEEAEPDEGKGGDQTAQTKPAGLSAGSAAPAPETNASLSSSTSLPVQEDTSATTPLVVDNTTDEQQNNPAPPSINVPEPTRTPADQPAASPPKLRLPSVSPSPVQLQPENEAQRPVEPLTPRLLPLSSATLPSTTPQISPLATKNTIDVRSNHEPSDINGDSRRLSGADAEIEERTPASLEEAAEDLADSDELPGDADKPSAESIVVVDDPEQASSDEDDVRVPQTTEATGQITQADLTEDAAPDESMDDYDEDEDDDMIMHEDDAEDVFDADALDGEDPGDDESDEDLEMLHAPGESEQLPHEVEDVSESEEERETHVIEDSPEPSKVSPPKETTLAPEERQHLGFVSASTLLQHEKTPSKESLPAAATEPARENTPPPQRHSFGLDGTVASTEVTPAAKSTDTPKTTPQSARDRVMKKTLQSLFGFKGTPSPEKEDVAVDNDAGEGSVEPRTEPQILPNAQDDVMKAADFQSRQSPETEPSKREEEHTLETAAVHTSRSGQSPAAPIELDSSSEEEDQTEQRRTETAEYDQTPSKPASLPQQRSSKQVVETSQSAFDKNEVQPRASAEEQRPENPSALDEDNPDPSHPTNLTGSAQEVSASQEQEAIPPRDIEMEAPLPQETEPQDRQSMEIFEGLEDIPGQDVEKEMQIFEHKVHQEVSEPLQPAAKDVAVQSETTASEQPLSVGADLINIDEEKVTETNMLDAQPNQPITTFEANDEAVEVIDVQQERASSPMSFQSQVIAIGNDTNERPEKDHQSRPASRDTIEDFSPVALGSLSKRVSDIVSDEAAAQRLQELESCDVEMENVEYDAPDLLSHGVVAEEVKRERTSQVDEQHTTPSRATKTTTVIDLESSPSGLEDFSPVKFTQSSRIEDIAHAPEDRETTKAVAGEDAQEAIEFDSEADAEARDRQLRSDDTRDQEEDEDIARAQSERRSQQPMVADTEQPVLPVTPSLTQSTKVEVHLPRENDTDQATMQPTPLISQTQQEAQSIDKGTETKVTETSQIQQAHQDKPTMSPAQPPPKTPARKSLRSRLSNVPDVISAWFSPKRSSIAATETENPTELEKVAPSPIEINEKDLTPRVQVDGLSTAHSYFASLSNLDQHLNPSSQQAHSNPGVVDVLAVVTNSTKEPQRAKGGPRDYYTIFQIADQSLPASSHVRVEVFRPWKAVLPAADVGDVVLLRAFVVKSKQRSPYLLSTDASGWCVWRFGEHSKADAEVGDEDVKPIWAKRRLSSSDVREEVKGPPVEYGIAEKEQARNLRSWWLARQDESVDGQGENGHDGDASVVEL